ncbi:hypothetical protein ACLRDC_19000 [Gluconacetobacter sacchari]|uniref:hypothetical protein n=1 Tax=Gluconacetobacter sacchari TaxID=92759 RepID=UPI0039B5DF68
MRFFSICRCGDKYHYIFCLFFLYFSINLLKESANAESPEQLPIIEKTLLGGISIAGKGELPFVPKGSAIAGSVGFIVRRIKLEKQGVQNFGDNSECLNTSVAAALGGNVCQYVWVESTAAGGQNWAQSLGLTLDPDFGHYTGVVSELDINNLARDRGEFGIDGNNVGILLNGLKYMNTAGISIQTGNMINGVTGTNGRLPIWFHGIHIGTNATLNDDFESQSNSAYGILMHGAHGFAIHLADDNSTQGAIALGNLGPSQGIVGRNRDKYYPMLYMNTDGYIHIGNVAQKMIVSDGNMVPESDNSYSLGAYEKKWSNIFVHYINNVPVINPGKPIVGGNCNPGAQKFDKTKFYMCLMDSRWHTMATASD